MRNGTSQSLFLSLSLYDTSLLPNGISAPVLVNVHQPHLRVQVQETPQMIIRSSDIAPRSPEALQKRLRSASIRPTPARNIASSRTSLTTPARATPECSTKARPTMPQIGKRHLRGDVARQGRVAIFFFQSATLRDTRGALSSLFHCQRRVQRSIA